MNFKISPDEKERVFSFIKKIPEGINITSVSKSFLGIKYKNKIIFTCKICGQEIHPKKDVNGHISWQCPNNCKINGKKDK